MVNPKDKVPSFELCEKLWDSGITKDIETERMWFRIFDSKQNEWLPADVGYRHNVLKGGKLYRSGYLAFQAPDLSEIHRLLGNGFFSGMQSTHEYFCDHAIYTIKRIWADTELNACAEMLIALREKGVV